MIATLVPVSMLVIGVVFGSTFVGIIAWFIGHLMGWNAGYKCAYDAWQAEFREVRRRYYSARTEDPETNARGPPDRVVIRPHPNRCRRRGQPPGPRRPEQRTTFLPSRTPEPMLRFFLTLTVIATLATSRAHAQCATGNCRVVAQPRYYQPRYIVPAAQAPAPIARPTPSAYPATQVYAADPLAAVNHARARRGLHALAHDANLAAWASHNNSLQRARGLGHHATGGAAQCAAIGTPNAQHAVVMWTNSPAHAALMFSPNIRVAGIAVDGYAATLNVR